MKLRFRSIYSRILTILLILTLLPLFGVGFFVYLRSAVILENMITDSSIQTLSQAQLRLDSFITEAATVAETIANYPDFQQLLEPLINSDEANIYTGTQEFVRFSKLMTLTHPDIVRITIVGNNLRRIDSLGRYLPTGGNYDVSSFRKILSMSSAGILPPDPKEKLVSYSQSIYDSETGSRIGMVIVDLDLNQIRDYLQHVHLLQNGYLFLVDVGGNYVYHPVLAAGTAFDTPWPDSSMREPYFFTEGIEGHKTLVIHGTQGGGRWLLYGIVPYSDITRKMADNRNAILIAGIILAAAILAVAYFLRTQLVEPIRKLQSAMSRVERGDLQHSFTYTSNDEIGKLSRGFNRMVGRIEELINDIYMAKSREADAKLLQQEAQYEALEARVTPHFLYNTLDAVGWLARDKGVREITSVVDALAGMLRYSLERSSPLATLKQEFEHASLYADIIDFRIGGRVRFRFDLPPDLQEVSVPRFTLQPLVENVIQHGVELMGDEAVVYVRAYTEREVVWIEVADTGTGVEPHELVELRKRLDTLGGSHASSEGIGLPNVHQRLKMNFGDDFGLTLLANSPNGFIVRAAVPHPALMLKL